MTNAMACLVLLPLLVSGAVQTGASDASLTPVQKVVKLVTEMKAQTIKEGEDDLEAYNKYKCWCESSEAEKTDAVKAAETKLQELGSFVEEAAAKEGELKTEIAALEDDIAADQDALASATSMRAKENNEFEAEEADMKETLGLLSEAVAVLSKVQLVQKQHNGQQVTKEALIQVRGIVKRIAPQFKNVMQKDLFDMLGEFQGVDQSAPKPRDLATSSFLGEVFLPKREAAMIEQARQQIPTGYNSDGSVTSEEDLAKATNPNSEQGAGAGAKSHNSRSGGIVGLLKAQEDEFTSKLASAQKSEAQSLSDFNALAAAKSGEIGAASKQADDKGIQLADLLDKAAKAKEDIDATQGTLTADEAFLVEMTKNCAEQDEEYGKRNKVRSEEIEALGETLNILTGDEARALMAKTMGFLQIRSVSHNGLAQDVARSQAMQKILDVARKHKNWMLATLAVSMKLDAFKKVIAAMDKMSVELQAQQKEEVAKKEKCAKDIDTTEDSIWTGKNDKDDLSDKHKDESNTIKSLSTSIDELNSEVADAEVGLKEAGEQRKSENKLFQTAMADQRATIAILTMALDRLKEFYAPKGASMVQARLHVQATEHSAVAPPPPKPAAYEKSASSGGVLQLLNMIIADAGRTEDELKVSEQKTQEEYAGYVASSTASIEADRRAIAEQEKQSAGTKGDLSETQEGQLANGQSLDKLSALLTGLHGQCDYIIKYFDIRQQSRAEEMDAIGEAKAILSGAAA